MVGAKLLQGLRFLTAARCSYNCSSSSFGELRTRKVGQRISQCPQYRCSWRERGWGIYLYGEDRNTASSLSDNDVSRFELTTFQSVQRVPSGQPSTRECCALFEVEVLWHVNKSVLVVRAVLAQTAVNDAPDTSSHIFGSHQSSEMSLIEQSEDLVSLLEPSDTLADIFNHAGSIGAWNDTLLEAKGVHSLGNDEVAIVERCSFD